MIILRQKAFTRAEREALKQLYKVTSGFRRLPNGITSLEDAKASKGLAIKLNEGNQSLVVTDAERQALNNLGLSKWSNGLLEKVHRKYNNGKLLDRTQKIKGNVKVISPEQLERNKRKLEGLNKPTLTTQVTGLPNSEEAIRYIEGRKRPDTYVLEAHPLSPSPASAWETSTDIRKRIKTLENLETNTGIAVTRNNVDKARKFKEGERNGLIVTKKDFPEVATVHELSHNLNAKYIPNYDNYDSASIRLVNPKYGSIMRNVGEIAEENLASSRTLRILRKRGNPDKNKQYLDNSINSYLNTAKKDSWEIKGS